MPATVEQDTGPPSVLAFQRSYGTNWTQKNMDTIFEWLAIAAYNIRVLELCCSYYRLILRNHTIIGLIMSTLSGTASITQFGVGGVPYVPIILNIFLTVFSFSIAIYTGALKVYQIHERLEEFIKIKQQWIIFSTGIASELQLPLELRRDALYIITKNKTTYLELLKTDLEIPTWIKDKAAADMPRNTRSDLEFNKGTSLHRIIMNICENEIVPRDEINIPLLLPTS